MEAGLEWMYPCAAATDANKTIDEEIDQGSACQVDLMLPVYLMV